MQNSNIVEMSTAQYAEYISELTGRHRTSQAVANDCRNGKLDCYRECEGGSWRIIVKRTYVPARDYDELYKKYNEAITMLAGIKRLVEGA